MNIDTKSLGVVLALVIGSTSFGQHPTNDGIGLIYSPDSGDIQMVSYSGPVTTFELTSANALFTGVDNAALKGLFDVNSAEKVFKLEPAGFNELDLPGVLPGGTPCTTVFADISIAGSFAAGGSLAPVHFSFCPEPPGTVLLVFAALGLVGCRRARPRSNSKSTQSPPSKSNFNRR